MSKEWKINQSDFKTIHPNFQSGFCSPPRPALGWVMVRLSKKLESQNQLYDKLKTLWHFPISTNTCGIAPEKIAQSNFLSSPWQMIFQWSGKVLKKYHKTLTSTNLYCTLRIHVTGVIFKEVKRPVYLKGLVALMIPLTNVHRNEQVRWIVSIIEIVIILFISLSFSYQKFEFHNLVVYWENSYVDT